MHASLLAALALAAVSVKALQVTSPDKQTEWGSSGSHTIEWDHVSSDPDSFEILLVNFASFPTTSESLKKDVDSTTGSLSVSYPDGSWPTGDGYQINFVNPKTTAILAQSNMFNITSDGETESSTEAATSSSSSSAARSSSSAASSSSRMVTSSASSAASTGTVAAAASESASSSNSTIPGSTGTTPGSAGSPVFSLSGAAFVGALGLVGAALA